ncbi:MAG: hypothetical protein ISR91_00470 [Candidatus Delongbacteria bacterium]|nr:hypothetical protein [Candidatus Delongbacteria bacterium]
MRLVTIAVFLGCSLVTGWAQGNSPVEPAAEGSTQPFHLSVGVGAVTMDGETYQQISLRPEIPLGKFGIGLDITIFFDADGNIRSKDWDEPADLLDKIRYLRYGHPGEQLYIRAGALDNVTLGYGILMKHYSNSIDYPSVRRLGANFQVRGAGFQLEGMFNDFRELTEPGLLGVRMSRPLLWGFTAGASIVADGNQYANLVDEDNDDVPDELDRFPGENDTEVYSWLAALYQSNQLAYDGLRGQYPEWPEDPTTATPDYTPGKDPVTAVAFDLGYPLLGNKLLLYAQGAHFVAHGFGIAAPGVVFQPVNSLSMGVEYRSYTDEFIPEFFDRTYELNRYSVVDVNGQAALRSRESYLLANAKAARGVYASVNFQLLSLVDGTLAYTSMHPVAEGDQTNTIYGSLGLNMARVPKLTELSAYYYQANVKKLFILEPNALPIWGYKIGYEITSGVNLLLNYRYTYQDLDGDGIISGTAEQVKTFSIETYFTVR